MGIRGGVILWFEDPRIDPTNVWIQGNVIWRSLDRSYKRGDLRPCDLKIFASPPQTWISKTVCFEDPQIITASKGIRVNVIWRYSDRSLECEDLRQWELCVQDGFVCPSVLVPFTLMPRSIPKGVVIHGMCSMTISSEKILNAFMNVMVKLILRKFHGKEIFVLFS